MERNTTRDGRGIFVEGPAKVSPSLADLLSARIAELLGRAIEEPETLTASETREMAASVVFYLISQNRG